jgi:hypothetical protein
MASNYRVNQPRCAQIMRQHSADAARAETQPPMRWDPSLDKRRDVRKYTHAQPTRQDLLKRQRRAARRAKQRVLDANVHLAQFEDTHVVDASDLDQEILADMEFAKLVNGWFQGFVI